MRKHHRASLLRVIRLPVQTSAVVLLAAMGLLAEARADEPHLGNCHMDTCSWSRELSRDFLGSNTRGMLYEVVLLGGSSLHKDGRYDRRASIKWNAAPHTTYVFCSKTMPLVMGRYDGKLQADFLQIGNGVIGAYLSSLSLYSSVCHNTTIKDEVTFARTFAYRPSLSEFEAIESQLNRPEDMLR